MLSNMTRSVCLLILLCLALPRVQAGPRADQAPIYLPLVQPRPVLVLSEPVTYYPNQYGCEVIGEVLNMSDTQPFSVTLQAVVYNRVTGITQTLTLRPNFPVIFPGQGSPYFVPIDPCAVPTLIVRSVSFSQVIPVNGSTIRPLTVIPEAIECAGVYTYGYITGSVKNDNTATITATSIVAWSLRNDASRGYGGQQIAGPLAPGAEQTFSTEWFPSLCFDYKPAPDISLDSFRYAAQGISIPSP